MALILTKLSLMVGADGASWYRYASPTDTTANMLAANYFNTAQNILNPGDMIVTNDSANANDILFVKTSVVATGVVTVIAALTAPVGEDIPGGEPPAGEETPADFVTSGRFYIYLPCLR